MLERKVRRSLHRKVESSRVRTLAERSRLSARLISPMISPGPRMARMTSVPSVWVTETLMVPERIA